MRMLINYKVMKCTNCGNFSTSDIPHGRTIGYTRKGIEFKQQDGNA
jgi:hypothetical protein